MARRPVAEALKSFARDETTAGASTLRSGGPGEALCQVIRKVKKEPVFLVAVDP